MDSPLWNPASFNNYYECVNGVPWQYIMQCYKQYTLLFQIDNKSNITFKHIFANPKQSVMRSAI